MINENRIKDTLETFSFPRLSGTKDEEKALTMISEKVNSLNLQPNIQKFEFSTFFGRTYPKVGFIFGFIIILFFYFNIMSVLSLFFVSIIIILLITLIIITRSPENVKFMKILPSANAYVKIPSNKAEEKHNEKNEKIIIFCCHLDSKGQKFSILARIRAIRTWVFSSIILFIIIILKNYILYDIFQLFLIIGFVPFIANLVATVIILLNFTNNLSSGAIDDASGISCVFELLNHYLEPSSRFRNYGLLFVFTGAEECGTMGIRHFFKLIENYDKSSILFFNFDAIARSVYLFPGRNPSIEVKNLYSMFTNDKYGMEIKSNPKKIYFGSHSDGYFMKKKGLQGIGIGDMNSYNFIHSKNDTPDKINYSLLKDLCETIVKILEVRDKQL